MSVNLQRYQSLKSNVDRLRREADRFSGALEQLLARLKDEYGCETLDDAKKLASKLESDAAKATRKFNKELEEFEEEFGGVLEST